MNPMLLPRPLLGGVVAFLVLVAGCAGPAVPPAPRATANGPVYDVIVVGAGLSGLTTAKELIRTRHSVLVLEATHRIGGRANTDTSFAVPIDLGAAWLHGTKTNPLVRVASSLGFSRAPTHLDGPVFIGDQPLSDENRTAYGVAYEETEERMAAESARGIDQAVSDFLPLEPDLRALVGANIGPLESGAEADQTSSADAAAFESDVDDFLREGIGTFVARFGRDVPVQLNSPVTAIRYGPEAAGDVVVEAAGQSHRGRRVVVTVSTGVLASGKIVFEPELPDWKRDAIKGLPMGLLNKVVLQFQGQILGDEVESSWVLYRKPTAPNAKPEVMAFVIKPLGANIVVGFFGGNQARHFEAAGDVAAIAYAKAALTDMYGADVVGRIDDRATKVTRWGEHPWTLGSYSAALPGASAQHAELARPIADRVFFAGEAAGPARFNGSLAAAYVSGLAAARGVRESLAREATAPAAETAGTAP
jgi:monoamine oxidase